MVALSLCCCMWAFSSCSEQKLLFLMVHRLLTAGLLMLWHTGPRYADSVLWLTGSRAQSQQLC